MKRITPMERRYRRPFNSSLWTPDSWAADRLLDYYAEDVVVTGGKVSQLNDRSPTGAHAIQVDAAHQGTVIAGANGQPCVRGVGVTQWYTFTSPAITGSWSLCFAHRVQGADGAWRMLFECCRVNDNTGSAIAAITLTPNCAAWCNGAFTYVGATDKTAQSAAYTMDLVADYATYYKGGALVGGNPINLATGVSAPGAVFTSTRDPAGYALGANSDLYRMVMLNRVMTAGDMTNWFGWTLATYGF